MTSNPSDIDITGGLSFSSTEFSVEARTERGRAFLAEVTGVTAGGALPTSASFAKSFLGAFLERAAAAGVREFLS